MSHKRTLVALAACLTTLFSLRVSAAEAERIVVPLTDPARPTRLHVELIVGSITVEAWEGKEVIVEARPIERLDEDDEGDEQAPPPGMKRLQNQSASFEVEEVDNRVSVRSQSFRRALALDIKVPRRTHLTLSTVNQGDLRVIGVEGDHELKNVNGGIVAERVTGSVLAETVNGDITVRLLKVTADRALAFSNMNGDIDVTVPANYAANVALRSDNGEVYSDFDLQPAKSAPRVAQERDGKRFRVVIEQEIRGTLGAGGPELRLQSFNGDLYLKKGG